MHVVGAQRLPNVGEEAHREGIDGLLMTETDGVPMAMRWRGLDGDEVDDGRVGRSWSWELLPKLGHVRVSPLIGRKLSTAPQDNAALTFIHAFRIYHVGFGYFVIEEQRLELPRRQPVEIKSALACYARCH